MDLSLSECFQESVDLSRILPPLRGAADGHRRVDKGIGRIPKRSSSLPSLSSTEEAEGSFVIIFRAKVCNGEDGLDC